MGPGTGTDEPRTVMSSTERQDHDATMHRVKIMKRWMWVLGILAVTGVVAGGLGIGMPRTCVTNCERQRSARAGPSQQRTVSFSSS